MRISGISWIKSVLNLTSQIWYLGALNVCFSWITMGCNTNPIEWADLTKDAFRFIAPYLARGVGRNSKDFLSSATERTRFVGLTRCLPHSSTKTRKKQPSPTKVCRLRKTCNNFSFSANYLALCWILLAAIWAILGISWLKIRWFCRRRFYDLTFFWGCTYFYPQPLHLLKKLTSHPTFKATHHHPPGSV